MNIPFINHVGTTEAFILARNLSMTLKAGVPLSRALKLFEEEATRGKRDIIAHLRKSVEGGNTLAHALETSPRSFPSIVINLVKAGEMGGTLSESLDTISVHLRKIRDLRRKIRSAMMYPTFVLVAIFGLGLSIGIFVLPELIPLFESLDVTLPWTTRALLWAAIFFENYGFIFVSAVLIGAITLFSLTRVNQIKPFWHRLLMLIPYINSIQRNAAIAQITNSLSTLLDSGIPIREAIPMAAQSTENRVFRQALINTLPTIEAGHTLNDGLRKAKRTFPGMVTTLVEIGEETGTLTETLTYLSDYYESEVDNAIKNLTTALEPILLIFIGIIVGGTVLAIITPIYDVTGSI